MILEESNSSSLEYCNRSQIFNNRCPGPGLYDAYANQCTLAYAVQFEDQDTDNVMKILYGVIFPILVILVVITNGVVVFILRTHKNTRSSVEPLLWMGVSAIFMALSPLPFTLYFYTFDHLNDIQQTSFLCQIKKICMEEVPFFFNTLITFLTLLLGVQRFIAIQYPLRSRDWCSKKVTNRAIKISFTVASIFSTINFASESPMLVHFCVNGLASEDIWVGTCVMAHTPLQIWVGIHRYSSFLSTMRLTILLIPSFTLFILTILLIRTLRDSNLSQISTQSHRSSKTRKSTSKTTLMLTVIIVLFLVARIPSVSLLLLNQLWESFGECNKGHTHPLCYFPTFSNMIFITVHPLTFAVYLLMSKRFRSSLRNLLRLKKLRNNYSNCAPFQSSRNGTLCNTKDKRQNNRCDTPLLCNKTDCDGGFEDSLRKNGTSGGGDKMEEE